jgi:hypothetical protein
VVNALLMPSAIEASAQDLPRARGGLLLLRE